MRRPDSHHASATAIATASTPTSPATAPAARIGVGLLDGLAHDDRPAQVGARVLDLQGHHRGQVAAPVGPAHYGRGVGAVVAIDGGRARGQRLRRVDVLAEQKAPVAIEDGHGEAALVGVQRQQRARHRAHPVEVGVHAQHADRLPAHADGCGEVDEARRLAGRRGGHGSKQARIADFADVGVVQARAEPRPVGNAGAGEHSARGHAHDAVGVGHGRPHGVRIAVLHPIEQSMHLGVVEPAAPDLGRVGQHVHPPHALRDALGEHARGVLRHGKHLAARVAVCLARQQPAQGQRQRECERDRQAPDHESSLGTKSAGRESQQGLHALRTHWWRSWEAGIFPRMPHPCCEKCPLDEGLA